MAILKKIILVLTLPILLSSCFSDFEPDIKSTPVLCMNCLLTEGDSIKLELTRTWRWSEGSVFDDLDINVLDADIKLFVNDSFTADLVRKDFVSDPGSPFYNVMKGYTCDYIPVVGDKIRFEAHSDKYGDATAEVTIPEPVKIDSVETTVLNLGDISGFYGEGGTRYILDLNMLVWFTDPSDKLNRYIFGASHTSSDSYYGDDDRGWEYIQFYGIDNTREPLFTEHVSALESVFSEVSGYTIFSDRQISGKSYPLHISINSIEYSYRIPEDNPDYLSGSIDLELAAISPSYYDHVLSVWVANDGIAGSLGSVGLGDAVFEASNVSTGAGVVAAQAKYVYKLNLKKLIEENL